MQAKLPMQGGSTPLSERVNVPLGLADPVHEGVGVMETVWL